MMGGRGRARYRRIPIDVGIRGSAPTAPAGAIVIAAGGNIQAAVNANAVNAVFKLSAGTYSGQTFTPKNGQQFYGEGNAVLNGGGIARALEGQFADNIRLNGIRFTNYAPPNNGNAMLGTDGNSDNWIVEHCRFDNIGNSCAITLGTNMIVRDNYFTSCWLTSIGAWNVTGALIEHNEMDACNSSGLTPFDALGAGGGLKVTNVNNVTIRRNWVHHTNNAGGIWLDIDCMGCVIEENLVEDNDGPGLMIELDYGAIVRNNLVRRNNVPRFDGGFMGGGAYVQNSSNTKLYGNAFLDNGGGIFAFQNERGSGEQGPWITRNMDAWGNDISYTEGQNGLAADAADPSNIFRRNRYWVSGSGSMVNGSAVSVAAWIAAGKDIGSIFNQGSPPSSGSAGRENFLDGTGPQPVSYWGFIETTGTRADSAAAANALSVSGTVARVAGPGGATGATWGQSFSAGSYLLRDNASVSAGFPGKVANTSVTVGCWVRQTTPGDCGIMAFSGAWAIFVQGNSWQFANLEGDQVGSNANITANTWTHVVGRWVSGGEVSIFINGVKQSGTASTATMGAAVDPLQIGWHTYWGGLNGEISQPFTFATALTDAQIADIAVAGLTG